MEQEEKKQKSQAVENQVSCPPQQPTSPHPFISVIPLAVLIALIVMVVKLFPDDALAGASQVALMIATAVCVALGMGIVREEFDNQDDEGDKYCQWYDRNERIWSHRLLR